MNTIEEIIPQRAPIIMVDKFLGDSDGVSHTELTVKDDLVFVNDGYLSESGILEHIAQSGAARMGYYFKMKNEPVPVGFIGAVKHFNIKRLPKTGETIHTTIKVLQEVFGITLVEGRCTINDEEIANCELKIFIENDEDKKRIDKHAMPLSHTNKIQVCFNEVDAMRIVWHGAYVKYLEDGREAFGKHYQGLSYLDMYNNGYAAPIVDMHIRYIHPLTLGDVALVKTTFLRTDSAFLYFEYEIKNEQGELITVGDTTQAFVDFKGTLCLRKPQFYLDWEQRWVKKQTI